MESKESRIESRARNAALVDRYSRSGLSPRTVRILIAALAVAFLAVVAWVGVRVADVDVRAETVSYEHVGDSRLEVTFQVTMRPGTSALCRVQAMDDGRAQVGFVEIPIPAQETPRSVHTVQIATQGTAASGSVLGCERT